MSVSKTIMAGKLCNVQKSLMEYKVESYNLNTLLPLIFKECLKENMTFWFSFIENYCVLNLRDVINENYELNIRQYHSNNDNLDELKIQVLCNTFLLTNEKYHISHIPSSANETIIISGDKPTPKHISKAIETLNAKGVPITVDSIKNHLPLGQMSTSARLECNKYLEQMRGLNDVFKTP